MTGCHCHPASVDSHLRRRGMVPLSGRPVDRRKSHGMSDVNSQPLARTEGAFAPARASYRAEPKLAAVPRFRDTCGGSRERLPTSLLLATTSALADGPIDQAPAHYRQGAAAFDERRFADALAEFERSYALHPAYVTLYNIGQVHVALGYPMEAIEALNKYLADGGESIAPKDAVPFRRRSNGRSRASVS